MITDIQKDELYREYHAKVFGYIRSKINVSQDAEDITADVFVKIFEKLDTFDARKASLSTWIYTITKNTLTDYYRTHRVFAEIPDTLSDDSSAEDTICSAEMLELLANALNTLDERERDIIILRFYFGKTLRQISAQMGISYAYVKVLQNTAFSKLKNLLQ